MVTSLTLSNEEKVFLASVAVNFRTSEAHMLQIGLGLLRVLGIAGVQIDFVNTRYKNRRKK